MGKGGKGSVVPARGEGGKGSKAGPPAVENLQGGKGSRAGSYSDHEKFYVLGMTPAQIALERVRDSISQKNQDKWAAQKSNQRAESATAPLADTERQTPTTSRVKPIPPSTDLNQPVLPIAVKSPNVQDATKSIAPLVKAADLEREQLEQEKQDDKDLREAIERDGEKRGKYRVLNKSICLENV